MVTGRLPENVMHFGRLLRRAGIPVGPGQVLEAIRAAEAVGPARRVDFYWALAAVFVNRREQLELYQQAFETFWRDPFGQDQLLSLLLNSVQRDTGRPPETKRRIREAWNVAVPAPARRTLEDEKERIDAVLTFSSDELLRKKDFEEMSADEIRRAKAIIERMRFDVADLKTRRRKLARRGRIDLRRTIRGSLGGGAELMPLAFTQPRLRPPALVILCDISGSMERYSRMFLHFVHTLTNHRDRVHTFLFGTRLTNVTRLLQHKDIDVSLKRLGQEVMDWSGGTRIRTSLHDFNRQWSRRVLGQGALVLLVTDGLDRDVEKGLAFEADRLRRSCRRLIWLNPLLRFQGFQPRAAGVKILSERVDEHRPVHDLQSLDALVRALE